MKSAKTQSSTDNTLENIVPVYRTVRIGDLSPDRAWLQLCAGREYSFLLESMEGQEKVARYSFLGWDPMVTFRSSRDRIEIRRGGKTSVCRGDPIHALRGLLGEFRYPEDRGLPRFSGGAVGYFGYDTVRFFEKLPDENPDRLGLADACFMFPRKVLVFDHKKGLVTMIAHIIEGSAATKRDAEGEVEEVFEELSRPDAFQDNAAAGRQEETRIESNLAREQYENMVRRAKEYIRAGDIFQVVLSQRLSIDLRSDPFEIFRTLGKTNPSPYMYYLKFDGIRVIGSSPEALVRVTDGVVETRPLAGTRRRGETAEEDAALVHDLLNDEKERAEHIMLVDLGRNDLGRVCEYGSVRVTELLGVEKYSHVMHLVSNVVGKLRPDLDAFDVLAAAFPAGTVSGAPKVRAMEIIDELEPSRRGIYAGAVGYVDFRGNLDTCIAIRTIIVKDGKAYMQAGAGIVADSVPEREYRETMHKAQALVRAVRSANGDRAH
jgi:anthranilate synthase component 1